MGTEWAKSEYTDSEVDAAGIVLADPNASADALDAALGIVNNWRLCHAFPLNTFQSTLRRKARHLDPDNLTAQRLKRMPAIRYKLQKHRNKPIPLSEMQDIGGCRAVVKNVSQLRSLHGAYLEGDLKHRLLSVDDYVTGPRFSGYRAIHLVYSYFSDKNDSWNGAKIEIQLRTQMQHARATAVETVGFFRQELLKSSEGDHAWKHFFKLMATEIALRERSVPVPNMPRARNELRAELRRCADHVDALTHLHAFGQGLADVQSMNIEGAHWFLLELDTFNRRLKITGYRLSAKARASFDYATVERNLLGSRQHDAVLVSVDSMAELKRVYTSYFLDMRKFIQLVEEAGNYKVSPVVTFSTQGDLPFPRKGIKIR